MPHTSNPEIIILGAGMAGLATAYQLAVKHNVKNIAIVDERAPLGLTSSKGTMAYRNWFPGPGDAMVRLLNRSIDLLQELDLAANHATGLSQNGYMYFTAQPSQVDVWRNLARDAEQRGVGEFREHHNAQNYLPSVVTPSGVPPALTPSELPTGTDLVTNPDTIRQLYPHLTPDATALLHVRRCGAFDAIALGAWLLEQAMAHGAQFIQDRVEGISTRSGRIAGVRLASGAALSTRTLVVATGPLLPDTAKMLGIDLPVYNELHAKLTMADPARIFPRYADLILWNDPQRLPWSDAERAEFSASEETRFLGDEFPGGVHFLPKGTEDAPKIMALWTYDIRAAPFVESPVFDPHYAEIVLRGLARMVPQARAYFGHGKDVFVDGGYYCKTRENRPLIGPLPIQGAYIIGALSGVGVMASRGAAELVSAHVTGAALPSHAKWFLLSRYEDPEYVTLLDHWDARSGQL